MECERLKKLVKNWYVQVQGESMAPARMVDFMRKHLGDCEICLADPIVELEVKRITEIVLPPSKIPKAIRKEEEPEAGEENTESVSAEEEDDTVDEVEEEEEEEESGDEDDEI